MDWKGRTGLQGTTRGLERLGGTAWTRALTPQGRAQLMHKASSRDQSSKGASQDSAEPEAAVMAP